VYIAGRESDLSALICACPFALLAYTTVISLCSHVLVPVLQILERGVVVQRLYSYFFRYAKLVKGSTPYEPLCYGLSALLVYQAA